MQRLDQLLVTRQLATTRSRAQRLIKEGRVQYFQKNWIIADKTGVKLPDEVEIKVETAPEDRYVSRGALKLLGALELLGESYSVTAKTAIDVGQSTGGFTDCLLQHGAARVVGIEVGHDQLDESLRADERVICLEGYNARQLAPKLKEYTPDQLGFDLAVMDVSFISQRLILDSLAPLIKTDGLLITLVKPQFELGPEAIGKGGIVKDTSGLSQLRKNLTAQLQKLGLETLHYIDSPIKGGDGNREYLLIARNQP